MYFRERAMNIGAVMRIGLSGVVATAAADSAVVERIDQWEVSHQK